MKNNYEIFFYEVKKIKNEQSTAFCNTLELSTLLAADKDILELVNMLNSKEELYTTYSHV